MRKGILILIFTAFCFSLSNAQCMSDIDLLGKIGLDKTLSFSQDSLENAPKNPRLVAAILCTLLGPFGAHRIYLGTSEKVPILYALTLGGGFFIVPIIDLAHILFTKDLEKYYGNSNYFMWGGKE